MISLGMPFNCINNNVWTFIKGRHPPGSLPSEISVALPPRKLQTCLAAAISSSEAATPFHRNRPLGHFNTNTSLVFSWDAVGSTWLRRERERLLPDGHCWLCPCMCLPKSLTSTARVARVELWRIWKRRVLPVWLWPPLREVPPLWMIMGFPLKRLIKWAGSWPWVTRTCRATQQWILNRVDLISYKPCSSLHYIRHQQ